MRPTCYRGATANDAATLQMPQSSDERAQAGTPQDMTIRSTAARFLGASTFALVAFAAQPALAQDADTAGAESTDGQLNTIIVTANRREENLAIA